LTSLLMNKRIDKKESTNPTISLHVGKRVQKNTGNWIEGGEPKKSYNTDRGPSNERKGARV